MAAGYQHAFAAKYVSVTVVIKDVAVAKSDRTISFLLEKQQRTYIYYCSVKSKSSERALSLNLHILEVYRASFSFRVHSLRFICSIFDNVSLYQ